MPISRLLIGGVLFLPLPLSFLIGVWLKYRALVKRIASPGLHIQDLQLLAILATAATLAAFISGFGFYRMVFR